MGKWRNALAHTLAVIENRDEVLTALEEWWLAQVEVATGNRREQVECDARGQRQRALWLGEATHLVTLVRNDYVANRLAERAKEIQALVRAEAVTGGGNREGEGTGAEQAAEPGTKQAAWDAIRALAVREQGELAAELGMWALMIGPGDDEPGSVQRLRGFGDALCVSDVAMRFRKKDSDLRTSIGALSLFDDDEMVEQGNRWQPADLAALLVEVMTSETNGKYVSALGEALTERGALITYRDRDGTGPKVGLIELLEERSQWQDEADNRPIPAEHDDAVDYARRAAIMVRNVVDLDAEGWRRFHKPCRDELRTRLLCINGLRGFLGWDERGPTWTKGPPTEPGWYCARGGKPDSVVLLNPSGRVGFVDPLRWEMRDVEWQWDEHRAVGGFDG